MVEDECGAPEYLSGGAVRMMPVDGAVGRMDLARLRGAIDRYDPNFVHGGRPVAVSITQSTELGTLYTREELSALRADGTLDAICAAFARVSRLVLAELVREAALPAVEGDEDTEVLSLGHRRQFRFRGGGSSVV